MGLRVVRVCFFMTAFLPLSSVFVCFFLCFLFLSFFVSFGVLGLGSACRSLFTGYKQRLHSLYLWGPIAIGVVAHLLLCL